MGLASWYLHTFSINIKQFTLMCNNNLMLQYKSMPTTMPKIAYKIFLHILLNRVKFYFKQILSGDNANLLIFDLFKNFLVSQN